MAGQSLEMVFMGSREWPYKVFYDKRLARYAPVRFLAHSSLWPLSVLARKVETNKLVHMRNIALREHDTTCLNIIMTAFNSAEWIGQAIASIQAQSFSNWRLWVIDDASQDKTLDIVRDFAETDTRISLYQNTDNRGTYWSKNWIMQQVFKQVDDGKQHFISFHDSDDISHPDRFAVQLGYMMSENLMANFVQWIRFDDTQLISINGRYAYNAINCLMIRAKDVISKAGFFDPVRIAADSEYHARLLRIFGKKAVKALPHILFYGRLRTVSLTRGEGSGISWQAEKRGLKKQITGARLAYHKAFEQWHEDKKNTPEELFVDCNRSQRAFAVPPAVIAQFGDEDIAKVQFICGEKFHVGD